ncbi:hypothetical protein Z951_06705 [Streptomyces sp. PRh5]|uniref:hypothetical protein n=1 Tax=Streptomyces sp. PRh5 TaxID=1158056 RepID=UPI00044B2676|nr:hypothetical protein [Streptomyces sp. PRh5]EXU68973.1 hypothetical protein Z951_06705 [Streptomyces sp. PRh5]
MNTSTGELSAGGTPARRKTRRTPAHFRVARPRAGAEPRFRFAPDRERRADRRRHEHLHQAS